MDGDHPAPLNRVTAPTWPAVIISAAHGRSNWKPRSHVDSRISGRDDYLLKNLCQPRELPRLQTMAPRHVKNVLYAAHPDSVFRRFVAYTQLMKQKTPPGFYFVLLLAALGFVCSTGLRELPAPVAGIAELSIPSSHARVGVYLTSYALTKSSVMESVYAANEAGQIDTLVINVKNMHGELTYASAVPLANEIGSSTGRLDLLAVLDDLRSRGFYLIARQVVFYDPLLATHLELNDSWTPCDSQLVCDYNLAIATEVAEFGFDELQFDYVRYPDGGALEDVYEDRFAAITAFLSEAHERLGDRITLSADIFGRVMWPWNSRRIDPIGQSLDDMAPYLDFISPMVYPSHYFEQAYRDDPYRTVQDALTSGHGRVDTHFRPFLQAFDRHIPEGMSLERYIDEQVRAAQEHGADGYLFWHPACEYAPLFRVLEPSLN